MLLETASSVLAEVGGDHLGNEASHHLVYIVAEGIRRLGPLVDDLGD
jgi:hypothetical protein